MPWAAKETVKRTRTRIAEVRPASRSARPASSTAVAISPTRPSVETATVAIARWRLPAASSALARRSASIWMPRWSEPDPGSDGESEHGQPAEQKNGEGGGKDQ